MVDSAESQSQDSNKGSIIHRYRDGYLVAKATIRFATLIKILGWIAAITTWIAALVIGSEQIGGAEDKAVVIFSGLIFGTIQLLMVYVFGVLLAAVGQVLRATLDTAVYSSPFLTESEKASSVRG